MLQAQLERWVVANVHSAKGLAVYGVEDNGRRMSIGFPTASFFSGAKN
jgi:hypothetical protein